MTPSLDLLDLDAVLDAIDTFVPIDPKDPAMSTATYPTLQKFLTETLAELHAGNITLDNLEEIFSTFDLGLGLEENEKAFASKLEEIGATEAPQMAAPPSPEYRRGFGDGFVAALKPDGKAAVAADKRKAKNAAKRQRQGRN